MAGGEQPAEPLPGEWRHEGPFVAGGHGKWPDVVQRLPPGPPVGAEHGRGGEQLFGGIGAAGDELLDGGRLGGGVQGAPPGAEQGGADEVFPGFHRDTSDSWW
ncbi:hypothetical protein [Amycolatopsis sp. DG1A-15b]|uniref:hypothetical protein n=1 Tax=Amycolatopsis sp. DG1A-15b TaxID=3052846 RepID=UPI00255BCD45|nr:hypothetical protein [Amycolatopsis sp. DG1A-15b]WIX92748.1 hypothetical protein QRY02_20810 [Amycolatopsis sp. DG1A-15b]